MNLIPALQEIQIRGRDLSLRPLQESDAVRILEILDADPEIRRRVAVASKMSSYEDVLAQIEIARQDREMIRYGIFDGDNLIGLISIWRDDGSAVDGALPQPDDYGFGYFLDPNCRGKGIVTAAMSELMETAAQNFYVRQFIAYCEQDNPASIAILKKLGFRPTGQIHDEKNNGWREEKYVKPVANA